MRDDRLTQSFQAERLRGSFSGSPQKRGHSYSMMGEISKLKIHHFSSILLTKSTALKINSKEIQDEEEAMPEADSDFEDYNEEAFKPKRKIRGMSFSLDGDIKQDDERKMLSIK